MDTRFVKSFFDSFITLFPHRVVFLSKFFIKPFATMSQIKYSTIKIFLAFLTFSQLCLAYPVLKILEKWKKEHKLFRMEDNLAVIP